MKVFALSFIALGASFFSGTIAAPATTLITSQTNSIDKRGTCSGHANLRDIDSHANGGGFNRWFWAFAGTTCGAIHDNLNGWSIANDITANRRCYDSGDGITFYFDVTTTKGDVIDGAVTAAFVAVTGQACSDMSLPDWAMGSCTDKVLHPSSSMCQKF